MIRLTDWESAWRFLSLHDLRSFFGELWLPFPPNELQPALRDILVFRSGQEVYHDSYGIVHAELTARFVELYGSSGFQYLCRWISDRFIDPGLGPEHNWWMLCHDLSRRTEWNHEDDVAVADLLAPLMRDVDVNESRLERLISDVFSEPEAEWDAKIRLVYDGLERSGNEARISLIASGNSFVCSWERWCDSVSDEVMRHLFRLGQSIAPYEVAVDLKFPGAWRAELNYFIEEKGVCAGTAGRRL